ncbi:P-loop NTPase fold protein [Microbulbifer sp. SAOS-129_SWC]|uniref:P-loop NTPase fold protein n=1 Tax=Microbulbifer sp. SAOS-129_SWC TaxID=3145235 RepID=UPI00321771EF
MKALRKIFTCKKMNKKSSEKSAYSSYSQRVIELLQDTSFPQIVLLNGSWGSGKTFFVKDSLIEEIKEKFSSEVHYFSLYGVSGIEDFRDRIISLSISNRNDASKITKIATTFLDGVGQNLGEKGLGGILNGVAGAYKYKIYSELDDCILILDDLERIPETQTVKNILGECLNLAESKNIRIVVIANEDKVGSKEDIEKVFVDKVKFELSEDQILEILKVEFEELNDDNLYNEISLTVTTLSSSNLRVLKRALSKFQKISQEIKKNPEVNLEEALPQLLGQIIRICYANLEAHLSKGEIIQLARTYLNRQMQSSNSDEEFEFSHKERMFDNIFSRDFGTVNEKLLTFCCDGLYQFKDIIIDLELPLKSSLLEKMLSIAAQHRMSSKEFSDGTQELVNYIRSSNNLQIRKWYRTCDIALFMIENKYIDEKRISKEEVLKICCEIAPECFDFSSISEDQIWSGITSDKVRELYQQQTRRIKEARSEAENQDFIERFCRSWDEVKNEAVKELKHSPFLNRIGTQNFIFALNNWSSYEIFKYSGYMREKYNFSNIETFFEPEHGVIKAAILEISKIIKEEQPGLHTGAMSNLLATLNELSDRMGERVKQDSEG